MLRAGAGARRWSPEHSGDLASGSWGDGKGTGHWAPTIARRRGCRKSPGNRSDRPTKQTATHPRANTRVLTDTRTHTHVPRLAPGVGEKTQKDPVIPRVHPASVPVASVPLVCTEDPRQAPRACWGSQGDTRSPPLCLTHPEPSPVSAPRGCALSPWRKAPGGHPCRGPGRGQPGRETSYFVLASVSSSSWDPNPAARPISSLMSVPGKSPSFLPAPSLGQSAPISEIQRP